MPDGEQYYSNELDQLLEVMRTRLSIPGVQDTDEGWFIHLALGCVENYWMRPDGTNEGGGLVNPCMIMVHVEKIQPVEPGMWEVTVRLVFSPDTVVTKQGSLAELARMFQASKPIVSPPVTLAPE
ncbi:hypothetical protein N7450_011415 [Penicillium hetheringtonii]|uniref:Uncharacterized protein n=1 Tax=Penicillium hetheringtonii TaxID=911720 RepID=A0AAD6D9W4_9EURO|nr:hypothetical protein N7450_011415 [Penicillium hetheringtonii]